MNQNKAILIIFFIAIILSFSSFANNNQKTIEWGSKQGIEAFDRSSYKNDFYQLSQNFQPQINPLYCGIASSVIILNTIYDNKKIGSQEDLEIKNPKALGSKTIVFNSYSQITFLNKNTDKIKDRKVINLQNDKNFDAGVSLRQLKDILNKAYKLDVSINYANITNKNNINKFRTLVKEVMLDNNQYLIVNFNGKNLGLETNGHISPIAAYDEQNDLALVMDVAGHKNGWYWVGLTDLFQAMHTLDGKNYRGYLIVSNQSN